MASLWKKHKQTIFLSCIEDPDINEQGISSDEKIGGCEVKFKLSNIPQHIQEEALELLMENHLAEGFSGNFKVQLDPVKRNATVTFTRRDGKERNISTL